MVGDRLGDGITHLGEAGIRHELPDQRRFAEELVSEVDHRCDHRRRAGGIAGVSRAAGLKPQGADELPPFAEMRQQDVAQARVRRWRLRREMFDASQFRVVGNGQGNADRGPPRGLLNELDRVGIGREPLLQASPVGIAGPQFVREWLSGVVGVPGVRCFDRAQPERPRLLIRRNLRELLILFGDEVAGDANLRFARDERGGEGERQHEQK